jgi:hypothetical protein
MSFTKERKKRLEGIAWHVSNSHLFLTRFLWDLLAIYYGGALVRKHQNWFAKKLAWQPHHLTILNAAIFNIGGSMLYFLGFYGIFEHITGGILRTSFSYANLDFNTVIAIYSFYNVLQGLFRVFYSVMKKKAFPSINIWGGLVNLLHHIGHSFHMHLKRRR